MLRVDLEYLESAMSETPGNKDDFISMPNNRRTSQGKKEHNDFLSPCNLRAVQDIYRYISYPLQDEKGVFFVEPVYKSRKCRGQELAPHTWYWTFTHSDNIQENANPSKHTRVSSTMATPTVASASQLSGRKFKLHNPTCCMCKRNEVELFCAVETPEALVTMVCTPAQDMAPLSLWDRVRNKNKTSKCNHRPWMCPTCRPQITLWFEGCSDLEAAKVTEELPHLSCLYGL
jgi:hypothetical protein